MQNNNQAGQNAQRVFQPGFLTPRFTASFPYVFIKRPPHPSRPQEDPKFEITMLFDKATTDMTIFHNHIQAAINTEWPNTSNRPQNIKSPIRDGDIESERDEYKGCWFIKVKTKRKPVIKNRDNTASIEEEDQFYGGVIARAKIHAFPFSIGKQYANGQYDPNGNYGVTFQLDALQKLEEGQRFGGGGDHTDLFGPVEDAPQTGYQGQASYQPPQQQAYQPPQGMYQAPQTQQLPNQGPNLY